MDFDLLKSAPEDQIEMMLMMNMDKLSEFSSDGSDAGGGGMMDFSSQNCGSIPHHVIDNNNSASFMNMPSNISFCNSGPIHQDPLTLPFVSSSTARWRNDIATHDINGSGSGAAALLTESQKRNSVVAMREMIFRIAAMQPINIDPESVKPPKRRNVKISKDPQSVAARHRRERISERIRTLQRLVPGGTKMDTASMLDEAIHYVKFLKNQVQSLERASANRPSAGVGFPVPMTSGCSYLPMSTKGYQSQNLQNFPDA